MYLVFSTMFFLFLGKGGSEVGGVNKKREGEPPHTTPSSPATDRSPPPAAPALAIYSLLSHGTMKGTDQSSKAGRLQHLAAVAFALSACMGNAHRARAFSLRAAAPPSAHRTRSIIEAAAEDRPASSPRRHRIVAFTPPRRRKRRRRPPPPSSINLRRHRAASASPRRRRPVPPI